MGSQRVGHDWATFTSFQFLVEYLYHQVYFLEMFYLQNLCLSEDIYCLYVSCVICCPMTLGYRILQWKIPFHSRHLDVASLFSDECYCKEGWRQPDSFSLCKWFNPLCRRPGRTFLCLQHPTSILLGVIFYFFPESLWYANWTNRLRNVSLHHWIYLWHGFPRVHSLPFNF